MGWTEEQFNDLCKRVGVKPEDAFKTGRINLRTAEHNAKIGASIAKTTTTNRKKRKSYENRIRSGLQKPLAKPDNPMALVEKTWGEDARNEGADHRIRVSIEGQRVHCIDPDNYTGGLKALIDCLQCAGLIAEDSYEAIRLETSQRKVTAWTKERTIVTIDIPEEPK